VFPFDMPAEDPLGHVFEFDDLSKREEIGSLLCPLQLTSRVVALLNGPEVHGSEFFTLAAGITHVKFARSIRALRSFDTSTLSSIPSKRAGE
jgi:hypothetical protein